MEFKIISDFKPTGDQPEAIESLSKEIIAGTEHQTLLGVTGSGKTFTIANVIEKVQKPTLILSHNKTLAAQLYGEFKKFFPNNAVEYFVSYYDYYQPEAYLPSTDTYIEKDLSINEEIEKLRLSTTSSLLSGRKDIIVVSSVSCIYGIGNPEDFNANVIRIDKGQIISRNVLLRQFVDSLYSRNEVEFNRGNFRVRGESIDIYPAYADIAYKIIFWDNEIDSLESFDPVSGNTIEEFDTLTIYPANIFMTDKSRIQTAIRNIQDDLVRQIEFFKSIGKHIEAKRLNERVNFDLEMIRELGHCSGIENYSRYFDGRKPGSRPFCLIDYFPDDYLTIIDESHVTIPQIRAMFGGDHSRKQNLVEYGFRLPAAIDNRPLKFEEFEEITSKVIYVSATPADYELEKCQGIVVEQVIRPTGIPDPVINIRPSQNQIDDLINEIEKKSSDKGTYSYYYTDKRMAEELSHYFTRLNIRCEYIHSDVNTLDRVKIMEDLRNGLFDVLIGVNLLREGLDLPEVSLVAILDADKEGFLRSTRSLIQTAGRAARNINGKVIMYADKITNSIQETLDATNARRIKQIAYNEKHNIIPAQIVKSRESIINYEKKHHIYIEPEELDIASDPVVKYMSANALEKAIAMTKKAMQKAAKELDFMEAARLRDEMFKLEELSKERKK